MYSNVIVGFTLARLCSVSLSTARPTPVYPDTRGFSWGLFFSRNGKSWSGEKEKPLVTLNLSLTFMQTPAVKRVKLVIQKGANDNLAITCLSAANVSTRVVRSSIFWPTWLRSMWVFAKMFYPQRSRRFCLVKHYCKPTVSTFRFVRKRQDFRIQRQGFFEQIVLFDVFADPRWRRNKNSIIFIFLVTDILIVIWRHSHIICRAS